MLSMLLLTGLLWALTLILTGVMGYIHYLHGKENYPLSNQWRILLFSAGFLPGVLGFSALMLTTGEEETFRILAFGLIGGLVLGMISLFLFTQKMKTIVPPQREE